MNQNSLQKKLSKLNIGGLHYFETIGSTNDEALAWAAQGAPDLSVVIADEQTAGRGRLNRKWFTPKGSALAFSIILRPSSPAHLSRTVGLAALSIADSCAGLDLTAQIKWPNDILLSGRKTAGILIETVWSGNHVDSLVVGMGVNVQKESVPPAENLQYPATSIEDEIGQLTDREELLQSILAAFIARREQVGTPSFMTDWENLLAFRGEQVQIKTGASEAFIGKLTGMDADGSLMLRGINGDSVVVRFGDVSLRPAA